MTTYTFQGYRARETYRFTCPSCGKAGRVRTFSVEHTVNPYNRNADGTVRTPAQVQKRALEAAKTLRDQFSREPLCSTCENALTWTERSALDARRRQLIQDAE